MLPLGITVISGSSGKEILSTAGFPQEVQVPRFTRGGCLQACRSLQSEPPRMRSARPIDGGLPFPRLLSGSKYHGGLTAEFIVKLGIDRVKNLGFGASMSHADSGRATPSDGNTWISSTRGVGPRPEVTTQRGADTQGKGEGRREGAGPAEGQAWTAS